MHRIERELDLDGVEVTEDGPVRDAGIHAGLVAGSADGAAPPPLRSQITSASEMPWRRAASATSSQGSSASGSSSQRARSRASSGALAAPGRGALRSAAALSEPRAACRSSAQPTCGTSRFGGKRVAREKLGERAGRKRADPDRLDAVLAHRLDPDRVAVGADRVAALRQPAELAEDVAADRVVGVGVDRQLDPGVGEVAERDVAADEPVAVGRAGAAPRRGGRSRPRSRRPPPRGCPRR